MKEIELDLNVDVLWFLFHEAHKKDITLNQLVNEILSTKLDELKKEKNGN